MFCIKKLRFLNGNTLKLLAALFMVFDHVGVMLFPKAAWLRFLGRFAMPLFAFMIAEGCRYTKNKVKHFAMLFGLGVACQIVYYIFDPTNLYLSILLTFSFSVLIIYALQYAKKCIFEGKPTTEKLLAVVLVLGLIAAAYRTCQLITVDYGFWGIMMPVFASIFDFHRIPAPEKLKKLDCLPVRVGCMLVAEFLLIVTFSKPLFQLPALLSFLLLFLYNGEKGRANLKYFFYIFYPLHLALLQGVVYLMYYV